MDGNGLDLRTWLTVLGVFVMFFGLPAASIAYDHRKKQRARPRSHGDEPVMPDDGPPVARP